MAQRVLDTPRPRFIVETLREIDARSGAARAIRDPTVSRHAAASHHRELVAAFVLLDTGERMVEERYANTETRRKFMELLRETLARTLERGEDLSRLFEDPTRTEVRAPTPQPLARAVANTRNQLPRYPLSFIPRFGR